MSGPPTLAEFGFGSMTQQGRAAEGTRPLLIVLAEYADDATGTFPSFSSTHPTAYYEALGFGKPTPPFSTREPINPASLDSYLRENSLERFSLSRAGVVGPVAMGQFFDPDPGPESRSRQILERVAKDHEEVFFLTDADQDGTVGSNELLVIIVENHRGLQPANRANQPFRVHLLDLPLSPTVTVSTRIAGVGPLTPFFQIAHELTHSLGTADVYPAGQGSSMLTIMAGYPFFADDQVPVHLDVWHKMALGWCEPRIRRMDEPGSEVVPELSTSNRAAPLILWHPSRGASEYFMVERRTPAGVNRDYDSGVAGDGVLVWRVTPATFPPVTHLGSPDLTVGGSGVWTADQVTPELRWSDGSPTAVHLTVRNAPPTLGVAWNPGTRTPGASTSSFRHLVYGGNGTTPVDSGLPRVGELYGIADDGALRWYCYRGRGVSDPSGSDGTAWLRNSGNQIGRGWEGVEHLVPRGNGVLLAAMSDGALRFFRYGGDGAQDPAGSAPPWSANSGNAIGIGWSGLRFMGGTPFEGRTSGPDGRSAIFVVGSNGDLRWFRYLGNGELDPTATGPGRWHPNSGNAIGRGWSAGYRHMTVVSDVILMVNDAGDLSWHRYLGNGELDPTATGPGRWHPNSGNVIGRGWHGFEHICGGSDGQGGYVIYGVEPSGALRWYRYTGQGESDPDGVSDRWGPNSGNVIGVGW